MRQWLPHCPVIKEAQNKQIRYTPFNLYHKEYRLHFFLLFLALIHIKRGPSQEKPPAYNPPKRVSILEIKSLVVDLLFQEFSRIGEFQIVPSSFYLIHILIEFHVGH